MSSPEKPMRAPSPSSIKTSNQGSASASGKTSPVGAQTRLTERERAGSPRTSLTSNAAPLPKTSLQKTQLLLDLRKLGSTDEPVEDDMRPIDEITREQRIMQEMRGQMLPLKRSRSFRAESPNLESTLSNYQACDLPLYKSSSDMLAKQAMELQRMQKWHAEKQKMAPVAEPPEPSSDLIHDSYAGGADNLLLGGSSRKSSMEMRRSSQLSVESVSRRKSSAGSVFSVDMRRASRDSTKDVGAGAVRRHRSLAGTPTATVEPSQGIRFVSRHNSLQRISEATDEPSDVIRFSHRRTEQPLNKQDSSTADARSSLSRFDRRRFTSFTTIDEPPVLPSPSTSRSIDRSGWWKKKV